MVLENVPRDKQSVPDSRAPKSSLLERIEAWLEANSPNEYQVKFIAQHIKGAQYEAVKKTIQRAMENPKSNIVKVREGWYRYVRVPEDFAKLSTAKRVGIHGIEIAGKCPDDPTRSRLHRDSQIKIKGNGQYSYEFCGRPVTLTVYPHSPTVLVQLQATNNPLTFEEFNGFCFWLFGWGAKEKILDHVWMVKEWGWNLDFINLDMTKSGFKQLRLKAFRNDWFIMYQHKQDILRTEMHLNPTDMALTDLRRLMVTVVDIANGNGKKQEGAEEKSYAAPPQDRGDYSYR